MNKRDVMFSLLDGSAPYIPAAFFLHFPPEFREGQPAIDKHLEYFHTTGMDFVKIQYERPFPPLPAIQKASDWRDMPRYDRDFFAGQLAVIEGIVKAMKAEAVVVVTLYSPFMGAIHTVPAETFDAHWQEDPDAVKQGMEIITESMLLFARECIKIGVDGFYHSTQGGETGHDPSLFEQVVKPTDLAVMNEVNERCPLNILHVCDYRLPYDDFAPFLDYPGDVVNCPLEVGGKPIAPQDAARLFNRPYMGGLERKGILATGTPDQVRQAAQDVLKVAPDRFVLAADCTVPSETPWANLKAAVDAAHAHVK